MQGHHGVCQVYVVCSALMLAESLVQGCVLNQQAVQEFSVAAEGGTAAAGQDCHLVHTLSCSQRRVWQQLHCDREPPGTAPAQL